MLEKKVYMFRGQRYTVIVVNNNYLPLTVLFIRYGKYILRNILYHIVCKIVFCNRMLKESFLKATFSITVILILPDSYYFAFIYRHGRRTKTRKPYKEGNHGRSP